MIKCSPECPGIRGLKVGGGKCGGKFGDGTANAVRPMNRNNMILH
jgi:hypothetical protein